MLLTDEEQDACVATPEQLKAYLAEPDDKVAAALYDSDKRIIAKRILYGRNIAEAEHAQTLKAVADWSGVRCGDRAHEAYDKFYRVDCNLCMRYLVWNASEGQMPGEEK